MFLHSYYSASPGKLVNIDGVEFLMDALPLFLVMAYNVLQEQSEKLFTEVNAELIGLIYCARYCIQKPEKESWGSGLDAMQSALAMEKTVNQCLLDLHKVAEDNKDAHVCYASVTNINSET